MLTSEYIIFFKKRQLAIFHCFACKIIHYQLLGLSKILPPKKSTTRPVTTTSSIQPDITPPRGTITINNDDTVTDSPNVVLSLLAIDNDSDLPGNTPTALSGQEANAALVMSFSNDGQEWTEIEPFTPTKMWTLSPGDGEKTVYVNFRDAAGNWMTEPAQDQILYQESGSACDTPHKLQPASIATSSAFLPFSSKNNAIDGNPSTNWSTLLSFFRKDAFITLDLGEIKKISALHIKAAKLFGTDFFPAKFQIQVSSDNITWQDINTETGFSPPLQSDSTDNWDLNNLDGPVTSQKSDDKVNSFSGKARKYEGMRRTDLYGAMSENAAQRSRWTFDEVVNLDGRYIRISHHERQVLFLLPVGSDR